MLFRAGTRMKQRIPLIRIASIIPIRDFLLDSGVRVDEILRSAQLPSAVFDDPELLLPYPAVARFLDHAGRLDGNETLGARAGHATPLESLGLFGRRVAAASTLGDALATAAKIARPYFSGESFWLTETGNAVRLWHRFPTHLDDRHQQAEQFSLCTTLRLLKSIAAPEWRPVIHLKKGMPRAIADLPMFRSSRLVFDQPTWTITFPRSLLRRPLPMPTAAAPQPADLERWMASAAAHDLPTAITQVVRTALMGGDADIRFVARWIGTSTRTLQRRLEDAGTRYTELVANARFAAAARLLADGTATLRDISRRVGYSDPAHFSRAFRRWAGCPPRAFRRVRMEETMARLVASG